MNLAHLHLLLNHVPTIGTILGLGLLLVAVAGKSQDLTRASLVVFFGIALLSLPTYVTGTAAQEAICVAKAGEPCADTAVSRGLIETHESAAFVALGFVELTGAVAWLGLWQFRRLARLPDSSLALVLVLALATFALMARAATMGGEIRHPEIRWGPEIAAAGKPLARQIGSLLAGGAPWMWPASETLHFIGLCLLFGIVLLVDLRMLGLMKSAPFPPLHKLLPWAMLGFGVNVTTGMLFFVGAPPEFYVTNPVFFWKLGLILLAGANALYFTMFNETWVLGPGEDAPLRSKAIALSAIFLWVGVIFCGHMLPFIGNAF